MKKLIVYLLLGISINSCYGSSEAVDIDVDVDVAADDIEFKGKTKKICKLCTECLTVTKTLKVNGVTTINAPNTRALATALTVNGPEVVNGTLNVNGSLLLNGESVTAGSGSTFLASYGQLSVASQTVAPDLNNWLVIPFTATGPSSNMQVSTTSPATITILQSGTYQLNVSIYFLTEYPAFESIYTPASYQIGFSTDGGSTVTPVTGVFASDYNERYAFNYSAIMELSANQTLQFYIEAVTDTGFLNRLVLQTGNVHLMQISN